MRKSGWEQSSNGPDWVDVESLMRAIGTLHSGKVGLSVLPAGIGSTGGLSVAAAIHFDLLPGTALPSEVMVTKEWPCSTHAKFVAHCFALLYELDFAISKTYKQESLWK